MNADINKIKVYWSNNRNLRLRNMNHVDVFDYRTTDRDDLLAQARHEGYKAVVFVDIRFMYKSYYEGGCNVWALKPDHNPIDPEEYESRRWYLTWAKIKFKNEALDSVTYAARCGISFYSGSWMKLDTPEILEYCMLGFRKAYDQGKDYLTTDHTPVPTI